MQEIARKKRYVEVTARFSTEGILRPLYITWTDGKHYNIDRILESRRAASTKAGGVGMRYLCQIGNNTAYLFYEDPAWFVEEKLYS